jgi:hypothetical protein
MELVNLSTYDKIQLYGMEYSRENNTEMKEYYNIEMKLIYMN